MDGKKKRKPLFSDSFFQYAFLIDLEKKIHFRFSKYFSGSKISPKKDATFLGWCLLSQKDVYTTLYDSWQHLLIQFRMVKAAKVKGTKVLKTKAPPKKVSGTPLSDSTVVCSPPASRNGATRKNSSFILKPAEQVAFKKYINEIKQISALVLLKCGLGLQESKCISKKMQEDYLAKNFERVYLKLAQDVIIGHRVSSIPYKFLTVPTSKATEPTSAFTLRNRYSAMRTYINNTLSPLWRK